jgi:SAM-dependent methyltransferase
MQLGPGSVEIDKIAQEFDGDACEFCERYKNKGLSRSSKLLLKFILDTEVRDLSVLDLGCGAGGMSMELLKEGASNAVGFDLSPKMVGAAEELARANGFESRAKFQLGNGATSELPESDIVVMDKVLCCYSEWQPLLKNAMEASRVIVGFTVPRDEGIPKLPFRLALRIANYFQRRRGGVLFYLHPLGRIDKTLRDSGFKRHRKQGSRFWLVFLYSRV